MRRLVAAMRRQMANRARAVEHEESRRPLRRQRHDRVGQDAERRFFLAADHKRLLPALSREADERRLLDGHGGAEPGLRSAGRNVSRGRRRATAASCSFSAGSAGWSPSNTMAGGV